ncbi:MAG: M48 family metalloprotease [Lachnospiraceae bacterium]|nr:M48 family metalloprotease [Lachnospiraceae bacterium]
MNITEININGNNVKLLEYVPECYCYISGITNNLLGKLRIGIETWVTKDLFEKMDVSIWIYDNIKVNAFAKYYEGKNYIALSVGLCQKFWEAATGFIDHENLENVFRISDKNKEDYIQAIYMYMLNFIIAHEFGHIVHGHLLINSDDGFIDEIRDEKELMKNAHKWNTQILEYDADSFAAGINTTIFLGGWVNDIKILLANFDMLFLSFYLSFSVLAEESNKDFSCYFENDITEYDHPHPGIRMFYCTIVMIDWIISNKGVNEITMSIIESGYHAIISFEKSVLKKKKIKMCYFSVSETEKGVQHIMNLVNGWNDMVDMYNKYSYIPIRKTDMLDCMSYFIDENGEFIQ